MAQEAKVFARFVPSQAVTYCVELYSKLNFEFKIKRSRQSKLGDFRYDPSIRKYTITVNNDLNPFAFLITYLHEVAHLVTYNEFGRKVDPHGAEWKANFRRVCKPVLTEEIFPSNVLQSLSRYLENPKASSCADPILFQVLKQYDNPNGMVLLKSLQPGDHFTFRNKTYRYESKRRTRMMCRELESGRNYLINQIAEVKKDES